MTKFGISQSVKRVEDQRFLTGHGRYVDDIAPEDAFHAYFYRSPVAHADITTLNVDAAREAEGVIAVLTAQDMGPNFVNNMKTTVLTNRDGSQAATPNRPIIAEDRVRFAGEILAVIIAHSKDLARDAADLIEFDYEERDAHVSTALGGVQIHDEAPENLVYDWAFGDEASVNTIFAKAAHTVSVEAVDSRIIVSSMEPRGCFAEPEGERFHFCYTGQGVWGTKQAIAKILGLSPQSIRATTPDVGGGFGMKSFDYPEYFLVAEACRQLGHSVRWMSDRSEAMMTDNGGRDLISTVEGAFDENHKLLALRIHSLSNMGAYCSTFAQYIQTELAQKVTPGVYDVQNVFFSSKGVFTNTAPVDAYRGAGRPEAIYKLERLMDMAARQFGVDPFELRRKNFIPKEAFPYLSATGETYDVGDFNKVLDRALKEADFNGFADRKAKSAEAGKLRGLGTCFYIESILGDQNENAKIEFTDDGMVNLYVGTQSNGQGHETVFAQFLNQHTGIPLEKIRFVQGDSDQIAHGGGTGGSRSVTMQGNAITKTSQNLVERFKPLAAEELEISLQDLVFENGVFSVAGTDRQIDMLALAAIAREKGHTDLLLIDEEHVVPARSYPNGAHICEVEIDPETGHTHVDKYTVVDDFGLLINPMLAEGQVHGGVVQGLGQVLLENVFYDETGQLLTASFMDYALPRADNISMIAFFHEGTPSTANDIGMKGCGEAGTVGSMAAGVNAVLDALWDRGIREVNMPLTPKTIWNLLETHE